MLGTLSKPSKKATMGKGREISRIRQLLMRNKNVLNNECCTKLDIKLKQNINSIVLLFLNI